MFRQPGGLSSCSLIIVYLLIESFDGFEQCAGREGGKFDMETKDVHNGNHNETVLQLVQGIFHDVRTLSTKEFTAAKLEAKQEIGKIAKASVSLGIGALVLSIGVVFLSLMIVFLLVQYTILPLWGSLGAVGLTYSIIGGIIILIGKSRAAGAKPIPEKTLRSTKEDVRYIRERATGH